MNNLLLVKLYRGELTSGTDCTGPRPDGPATGSVEMFGLDRPLLVGASTDVHEVGTPVKLPREAGRSSGVVDELTVGITEATVEELVFVVAVDDDEDSGNGGGIEFVEFELIVMFMPAEKRIAEKSIILCRYRNINFLSSCGYREWITYQHHWTLRRPQALANGNHLRCYRYRDYYGDGDHGWLFRAVRLSTLGCFSYDITLVELGMFAVLSVMGYIVQARLA